ESLWVDKYAPATEDQLGVNPKKIEEVRNALLKALSAPRLFISLKSGGQIILLSGPSGAGKSAVVHVLARELDLDILEWINPIDTSKFESLTARNDREVAAESGSARTWSNSFDEGKPSISNRFADFLSHARKSCPLAFVSTYSNHSLANAPQPGNPDNEPHRRVIVVEDLPNVLNASTRSSFYSALRAFVHSPRTAHPLILIATDTVVGAADGDMKWRERSMNVGNIIPTDLKQLPSVQKITFQPSANLFLIKALTRIASAELKPSGLRCTKDYLTSVCTASGGDIRCAINTLQFSSWPESVSAPATKTLKRGRKDKIVVLDRGKRQGDVGAREVGLVLFHAISKILMSKTLSSGEPEDVFPGAEPPIKPADIELSRVDLPQHLRTHERDRFKSHAENVFEASHTDAPTFVSFLSENYPPFFTEIEECASAADCLSKADALTSMHTLQATSSSYLASLATRGIMHSRRTPLPTNHFGRALHPIVKPKLFEATKTARETATAVLERSRQWSLSWMTRNKDVFAASEWGECGGGQATGFQLTTCHSKHDITHHLLPYIGKISGFTPASRGVHLELDPTEELLITSLSHYSFRRQSYFAHKEKLSDREVFLAEEEEAEGTAGMAANLEPPGPLSERDATRIQHGATGVPAGGHSVGTSLLGSGVIVPPVLAGGADPNGWVDPMDDIEDSD
ncbi:Rad17 cell cycle checkpoint protein-domain-containing protein, partial [Zopfochytrium polystomum]